jgi:hypothetical protein
MNNDGARRVIPIILVLIVIAVAIAAVVSIGQSIFGGGNSQPEVNEGKESLVNTSEDRSVRMTVRGPIVADEVFNTYTITASSTQRTMTTYVGYLNRQVETKQLQNNIPAYEQFVYALDRAQMMDAKELTGDANDLRGICATGRVYQFDTLRGGNVIKSLWTSTCKGSKGSLKASVTQLQSLFQVQIPDYQKMLSKIRV